MKEKIGAIGGKVKEKLAVLKKVPKKIFVIIGILLVAMIIAIIAVVGNRPYSVLVTGASGEEMTAVSSFLVNQGVQDYKIINNDTILVPESMEFDLKARLMAEGYPQTGFSYSTYYDHVGALSTESERNRSYLIQIQERLGAIIRRMENVKEAYVNITQGQDRSYVLDSGNVVEATAGVMVVMQGPTKLTTKQADAIRNLVAHSVQGLKITQVTINDTAGNSYNAGAEQDNEGASSLKLQLEERWSNNIRTEVLQVLTPFFGEENIRVGVNCVVDLSSVVEQRHDVYLPEYAQDGSTDGRGILGAEQNSWYYGKPDGENPGGIVGSSSNSDLPVHVEDMPDPDGTENVITGSNQKDYDNPKSDKHITTTAGMLKDCTISVSLNAAYAGNVDIESVREHVARAAGIRGEIDPVTKKENLSEKVSVMVMEFPQPPSILPPDSVIKPWMLIAGGVGLALFLLILFVILVIRKKKKKKKLAEEAALAAAVVPVAGEVPQTPAQGGADIMSLQSERNMELRKDIRQFASDNPEIAAQMVRGWLRGGDENG